MIFFSIIRDYNRKLVILLSLTMILILICLFGIIKNEYFLYFNRAITGIFQVIFIIKIGFFGDLLSCVVLPIWS